VEPVATAWTNVILLAALIAMAAFLAISVWRLRRKGKRGVGPVLLAAGLGLLLLLFALWFVRGEREITFVGTGGAPIEVEPGSSEVAEYAPVWKVKPPEGELPDWVLDPALLEPPTERSLSGGLFYCKPDSKGRLAGYSGFEADAKNARAGALECAVERLSLLVAAGCMTRAGPERTAEDRAALNRCIGEAIAERRNRLELDSYQDVVRLDYGSVHRAAVLLSAAPEIVDELISLSLGKWEKEVKAEARARREMRERVLFCAGGALFLLLIVSAVYLVLNAHTRGYYAWPLRIVGIVVYAAAVIAWFLLRHR